MTFEEFNRAMEFIVQQQAAFSVKLDRDHEWAKGVIKQLAVSNKRTLELIDSNMRRLDENEKFQQEAQRQHLEFQRESQRRHEESQRETQRRHEEFQASQQEAQRRHEEIVGRLEVILRRLTEKNNQKPN